MFGFHPETRKKEDVGSELRNPKCRDVEQETQKSCVDVSPILKIKASGVRNLKPQSQETLGMKPGLSASSLHAPLFWKFSRGGLRPQRHGSPYANSP